ncbi:16767_t:CDS:2 [Cetraspora pellucida]|uniref:16767_t:CDS:1 n=1 Tax=Cetraspora pellucida TaxID=1433469 RepID=A0A9N9IMH7_9GLOM|nr:16767_t:CDS:2 [Cetraspora pellucida]
MLKLLNPNATIPVGDTIRNDIIKSFKDESINIKCLLQSVLGKLSFAIDVWTSANIYFYFAITVHWISKDWKLQNILLDFINLHGSHSGENLCDAFVSSCCEFGILPKIFTITSDNTTNNDTFMQHLETICYNENIAFNTIESHCRCVAHIINLTMQDILKQFKAGKAQTKNAIFDNMNIPIMARNIILKLRKLNKIREIVTILEIFVRTTKMIESAKYLMLASIISIYNYLIDKLTKHCNNSNYSHEIITAINAGLIKLELYYSRTNNMAIYIIATVLDLRLKLDYYEENNWSKDFINSIKATILQIYKNNYESSSYKATNYNQDNMDNDDDLLLDYIYEKKQRINQQNEVELYLEAP